MEKVILPYKQEIANGEGCYITPSGEFINTNGSHADYAYKNFGNEKEFLNWVDYKNYEGDCMAEYAVLFRKYDRLRTIFGRKIQSSERFPNIRFYNWILEDWPVIHLPAMIWDEKTKQFIQEAYNNDERKMYDELNKGYGLQIQKIKNNTLLHERNRYFK